MNKDLIALKLSQANTSPYTLRVCDLTHFSKDEVIFLYGAALFQCPGRVIVLDDDLNRIAAHLEEYPNVPIHHLEGAAEQLLKEFLWQHAFKKVHFVKGPDADQARFKELYALFDHLRIGIHLVISDAADFHLRKMENLLQNLKTPFHTITPLQDAYREKSLLLCGASPELDRHWEEIEKLQGKAMIIVGGSAIELFLKRGVAFDAAVAVDPNPPYRLSADVPLFYQNRLSHKVLQAWKGPHVLIPDSGTLPYEKVFLPGLENFDGGWNVGTMMLALGFYMGFSKIATVGMDMNLVEGKRYAAGVKGENRQSLDFVMGKSFTQELKMREPARFKSLDELTGQSFSPLRFEGDPKTCNVSLFFSELKEAQEHVSHLLKAYEEKNRGKIALYEVLLDELHIKSALLDPLWAIFKHAIDEDLKLQEVLFFQRVLTEYQQHWSR